MTYNTIGNLSKAMILAHPPFFPVSLLNPIAASSTRALSAIRHSRRHTLRCLPQNISGYIIWNSFGFSAHSPLSALCSFCMAFTHCVLNFNPAMLQQFPLYLTQKAEPSYLCLLSCYCAGVMPPDLEKKIEKKEKKEIQMAHVPQLMSEAQICLVSERLIYNRTNIFWLRNLI